MTEQEKIHNQFENMIQKSRGQRSVITAQHADRFSMIEEQFKLVMEKYPGSAQRRQKEKTLRSGLTAIEEEDNGEGDNDQEEDDDF